MENQAIRRSSLTLKSYRKEVNAAASGVRLSWRPEVGHIDESRWRCRFNKCEGKYGSCVCHVAQHTHLRSGLYWSCDSPTVSCDSPTVSCDSPKGAYISHVTRTREWNKTILIYFQTFSRKQKIYPFTSCSCFLHQKCSIWRCGSWWTAWFTHRGYFWSQTNQESNLHTSIMRTLNTGTANHYLHSVFDLRLQ